MQCFFHCLLSFHTLTGLDTCPRREWALEPAATPKLVRTCMPLSSQQSLHSLRIVMLLRECMCCEQRYFNFTMIILLPPPLPLHLRVLDGIWKKDTGHTNVHLHPKYPNRQAQQRQRCWRCWVSKSWWVRRVI